MRDALLFGRFRRPGGTGDTYSTQGMYNGCTRVVQRLYKGCTSEQHARNTIATPEQHPANTLPTPSSQGERGCPRRASVRLKNLIARASNEANIAQHHARPTESTPIPQSNFGRRVDGAASPPLRSRRLCLERPQRPHHYGDRKSTRLNSSHLGISYA